MLKEVAGRVSNLPATGAKVEPVEVLLEVLGRATARFRAAAEQVDKLAEKDLWKKSIAGQIPHEWVRYEDDRRVELGYLTSRMISLEISAKDAQSRERLAEAYAIVIEGIVEGLELSAEQREMLPGVIRERLPRLLESSA
jgi:hypothetical protein